MELMHLHFFHPWDSLASKNVLLYALVEENIIRQQYLLR
jgi:hypothetical protein